MEAVVEAEQDLLDFVAAVPESDLGWAALLGYQMTVAEQLRINGERRRANEKFEKVEATFERALKAVPEGAEVAKLAVLRLSLNRADRAAPLDAAELAPAVDRMVELAEATQTPALLSEVAEVLRQLPSLDGPSRAVVRG